jgi:LCP family protein required for cell wall assembly
MRRDRDLDDGGRREPFPGGRGGRSQGRRSGNRRDKASRNSRGQGAGGRPKPSLRKRITGATAITLTCGLVAAVLYVYEKYGVAWDDINRVDVSNDLADRPPQYGDALNVLLIGSDTRSGRNGRIGGRVTGGARSDTVMLVHISPGRHSVAVLSFPRDSVVPIDKCAPEAGTAGQQAQPGQVEQLNSTFAFGGPGCLWHTLEQSTGIRIDDFVELTFVGFEKVINGIGGVSVCVPYAVNVPDSRLRLPAGRHHVGGAEALAFWRAREGIGLNSDLQRIYRDQLLMVALLHGIEKNRLLHSRTKMLSVLTDVARSRAITMDTGLTTGKALRIAESLGGLSPKSVQFIEVPTVPYPPNPLAWVQWAPQDTGMFRAIAHNATLPKKKAKKGKNHKNANRSGPAPVLTSVRPADVRVEVLNGTTAAGLASTTGTSLSGRGFDVLGASDASNADYTNSVIEYGSAAQLPAARTLAAQLGDVTLQQAAGPQPGVLDLILGSTFTGLSARPKKVTTQKVGNLAQAYGGITGNAKICAGSDSRAFES